MKMPGESPVRLLALARFGDAYRRAHDGETGCVYCGELREVQLDHVPPLGLIVRAKRVGDLWLYEACATCNRLLRDYPAACLVLRSEYIRARLRGEWARIVAGAPGRYQAPQVRRMGEGISRRLAGGDVAALCRCGRCQSESKTPGPCGPGAGAG